jgi:hypothetical protein
VDSAVRSHCDAAPTAPANRNAKKPIWETERTFLAASAASLALPAVVRADSQRLLKFIPQ